MALACTALALFWGSACDGGGGGEAGPTATPAVTATASPDAATPGRFSPTGLATPPPAGEGAPGGRIAFVSFRDGQQEIYVMNADGSGLTNLTQDPAVDFDPDWSPDGRRLVFASDRDGPLSLYSMAADGGDVQLLAEGVSGISPKWSPDGSRIAYSRGGTLVVMEVDGGEARVVLEGTAGRPGVPCSAGGILGDWSPDGQRLAYYTASIQQEKTELCTVEVEGSKVEVVLDEPAGFHAEPNWSADGSRLTYRSIREGVHAVYALDLATGEETRLTELDTLNAEPAWSPDGGWITFVSDRDAEESDIYVMSADGSDVRRLTTDPAKDSFPTWAPAAD